MTTDKRAMSRPESNEDRAVARPERVSLSKQKVMSAPERKGFKRRWINEGVRVDMFLRAGWTLVEGDNSVTHQDLGTVEGQPGSYICRAVNKNAPEAPTHRQYLVEIPIEWYDENKADYYANLDAKERSFDKTKNPHMYGGVKQE